MKLKVRNIKAESLLTNSDGIEYIVLGSLTIVLLFSLLKWGVPSFIDGISTMASANVHIPQSIQ